MFCTKSRKEQLQETSASLAGTAATVADQLRERVVPAVGQAAGSAIEWSQPRVEAARSWARPRVEHGIEVAAPKLESAVSGLAPRVDTARDKIVDELLPRIAEAITAWAAASTAAKDEAVSRSQGAAAVISGDAVASPKCKKKSRVLLTLGLLTATAAAAVAFMRKSPPKDDPWTTPLADPSVAESNGRHSAAPRLDEATDTTTGSEVIDALDETGAPSPLDLVEDPSITVDEAANADTGDAKNGTDENPPA